MSNNPRDFFNNMGYVPFEFLNESGELQTRNIIMPEGGILKIGYFHCNYANYRDGEVEVERPNWNSENDADSQVDTTHIMSCGRCGKEFSFHISNTKYGGVYITEDMNQLSRKQIYVQYSDKS